MDIEEDREIMEKRVEREILQKSNTIEIKDLEKVKKSKKRIKKSLKVQKQHERSRLEIVASCTEQMKESSEKDK